MAGQFLDAFQPVEEGVAVDEKGFGRLADIAVVVEVGIDGLHQGAVVPVVVINKRADDLHGESPDRGNVF